MAISESLNRRIRARRDEYEDEDEDDFNNGTSSNDEVEDDDPSGNEEEDTENDSMNGDISGDENDESDEDEEEDEESESENDKDDNEAVQSQIRQISFGALAKAQNSLGKRKRGQSNNTTTASQGTPSNNSTTTLDDIRERLRKAREQKQQESKETNGKKTSTKLESRSSKHAPTVQSSKYAVSRKRIVVEPPNAAKARDPRFDPAVMSASRPRNSNNDAMNNAYSFLDEYRSSEIKQLKEQMSRTKDAALKEKLKREITSATDRQRALENKKREREVLREHKKRERQLLREGKKSQPYYLKKSELKREVLKKKYESMGSKERAKALERRRKKIASKEKKDLPWSRRGLEN